MMSSSPLATYLSGRVTIILGDLTLQPLDAIVNAANATLRGGGGVDGAIHAAGGPAILEACEEIRRTRYPRGLPQGEAVITTGGNLPARYVIHTVGPVYGVDPEQQEAKLASCYRNSLLLARQHGLKSVGFPAISTGIYRYPREEAAQIASETVRKFLEESRDDMNVVFVFFSQYDAAVFIKHQRFEGFASV